MKEYSIEFSAPGKVIISGEHSVVYGKPAIACAVDKRTSASASIYYKTLETPTDPTLPEGTNNFQLFLPQFMQDLCMNWVTFFTTEDPNEMYSPAQLKDSSQTLKNQNAFGIFLLLAKKIFEYVIRKEMGPRKIDYIALAKYLCGRCTLEIIIKTEVPIGSGLGSSASASVALSATLLRATRMIIWEYLKGEREPMSTPLNDEFLGEIDNFAFEGETIVHKSPSGVDNAISRSGGGIHFIKDSQGETTLQCLKINSFFQLGIINTGIPKNTRQIVEAVGGLKSSFPFIFNNTINSIAACTDAIYQIITIEGEVNKSDVSKFKELIRMNNALLGVLGVGHPSIFEITTICEQFQIPAKLTGGGCGGNAICFIITQEFENPEHIKEVLTQKLGEKNYLIEFPKYAQGIKLENEFFS